MFLCSNLRALRFFSKVLKLSSISSSESLKLNMESTALSLVMLRLLGGIDSEDVKILFANEVLAHPDFNGLVDSITRLYGADLYFLDRIFDYSDIMSQIRKISDDVYNGFKAGLLNETNSSSSLQFHSSKLNSYLLSSQFKSSTVADFNFLSAWNKHEPWTWYTDSSPTWIKLNVVAEPFLAYSDKYDLFASGNPTLHYYQIIPYENNVGVISKVDTFYIAPRLTSGVQKIIHSGAQQGLLKDIIKPNITNYVRFERSKSPLVMFLNLLAGAGYILDVIADGSIVTGSSNCLKEAFLKKPMSNLDKVSKLLDVFNTFSYSKDGLPDFFKNNFTSMLETLGLITAELTICSVISSNKQMAKLASNVSSKLAGFLTGPGWIKLVFDGLNGIAPWGASWVGDGSLGYRLDWQNGNIVNIVLQDGVPAGPNGGSITIPVANFEYTHQSGLLYHFDGSPSVVDSNSTLTYKWTIDGVSYTGAKVSHTFGSV